MSEIVLKKREASRGYYQIKNGRKIVAKLYDRKAFYAARGVPVNFPDSKAYCVEFGLSSFHATEEEALAVILDRAEGFYNFFGGNYTSVVLK